MELSYCEWSTPAVPTFPLSSSQLVANRRCCRRRWRRGPARYLKRPLTVPHNATPLPRPSDIAAVKSNCAAPPSPPIPGIGDPTRAGGPYLIQVKIPAGVKIASQASRGPHLHGDLGCLLHRAG